MIKGSHLIIGDKDNVKVEIEQMLREIGFEGFFHPDIHLIEPNSKSIGIGETRELIDFLVKSPFSAKKKVAIILESEKLTLQAQNSLLKTLEEPPSYAIIILGVNKEGKLLDTILSRCQKKKLIYDLENIEQKIDALKFLNQLLST